MRFRCAGACQTLDCGCRIFDGQPVIGGRVRVPLHGGCTCVVEEATAKEPAVKKAERSACTVGALERLRERLR